MKPFVKQKFYGKLLSFLKFKRHKKVRSFISFSKKKLDFNSGINYNSQKREFYLKKVEPFYNILSLQNKIETDKGTKSNFFLKLKQQNKKIQKSERLGGLRMPAHARPTKESVVSSEAGHKNSFENKTNNLNFTSHITNSSQQLKIIKKKYKLNSFLFNMLCHYSRGRLKTINGKEFFTWYYTVPYRLSLSRFIGNKVLRSFYQNLNKKNLLNLRKKLTIKAKRSRNIFTSAHPNSFSNKNNRPGLEVSKKEIGKNLILSLEKRLDSSLLRLLQFKSLYTRKYALLKDFKINNVTVTGNNESQPNSETESKSKTKNIIALKRPRIRGNMIRTWKVKSPWKNYSSLQMKQKINHGHILVNGKKVKSPNIQINSYDKITIGGLVRNPLWTGSDKNMRKNAAFCIGLSNVSAGLGQRTNHKDLAHTFFFRDPKKFLTGLTPENPFSEQFKEWLGDEGSVTSLGKIFSKSDNRALDNKNIDLLCFYVRNAKIKRFSEIFYLTYKNFFLFSDGSCSIFAGGSPSLLHRSERSRSLSYIFQTVGYNQSIYFLWPLVSLLSVQPWNSEIKNNIVRSSSRSSSNSKGLNNKTKFTNAQNISPMARNLKNLLNLKNYQNKFMSSVSEENGQAGDVSRNDKKKLNSSPGSQSVTALYKEHYPYPSWGSLLTKSLNCYASFVYGTRKCKWVQLQQQKKGYFYNKVYNKIQFFELELDFFQSAYGHYKNG